MQELTQRKKELVSSLLKKGILLDPELIDEKNIDNTNTILEKTNNKDLFLLNKTTTKPQTPEQKEEDSNKPKVKVVFSYIEKQKKREVQDFVSIFNKRYTLLKNILLRRQELQNTTSIKRVLQKTEKEKTIIIGIVKDKQITKNNNIILTLEDPTDEITVVVSKTRGDTYLLARDIVLDEVIGVTGQNGDKAIFANTIYFPDVPLNNKLTKATTEGYAIFLSDLHVGSKYFLPEKFIKFLKWIKGESGNEEQRNIANKIKYVFVVGDLVDGVGIYPAQDEELEIKDIYKQYDEFTKLISQIPQDKKIIICPGNHDAMRIAEPQLPIFENFAKELWDLPNTIMVSNPAVINIHSSPGFDGINVLLYHGYSFDYYVANVETLRKQKAYDNPHLIMKFLLQKRHLAPSHGSNLYIPDIETDPMVVKTVPDVFVSGHIHKSGMVNYRNVTLVCGSCWQSMTSFQEKVGHHPEPGRVPILNLKTRDMKVLRF